jgi:hypothetical protein
MRNSRFEPVIFFNRIKISKKWANAGENENKIIKLLITGKLVEQKFFF